MDTNTREKYLHRFFIVGILLKAFDGVLEILGGIALLFSGALAHTAALLIQHELIEDPSDALATHLQQFIPLLAGSSLFATIYLLSHGVIKLFLAAGLLSNKLWAYPTAIVVFVLFVVYQMYRYTFTHSPWLIVFTVIDIAVIWLTWHEYRYFKRHHAFPR